MHALVVTHGDLGAELIRSAQSVYSVEAPIEALSNRELSVADLRSRIELWLEAHPGPAILLVDVGGGSCGAAALQAANHRSDVWVLGGVNLAMVLTFLSSHSQLPGSELVAKILDRALNAVGLLGETW